MIRNVFRKLGSLRSTLAVGVGIPFLVASAAFAQNEAPTTRAAAPNVPNAPTQPANNTGGGEASTERVIVTGSYIPTAETESALPVTVYTAEVLQKQGANTPVEGLRQLPSFVGNAATENDSNGGNGQANINLRAIGAANTLTLINGRRAFEYSDINAIPIGAVRRTEVLKDGASAIYGSDAVAGVVNFILLNGPGEAPYQGAEIFALYGNTTESDAHVRQVYIRGGVATDKVSIAAAGEYYSRANLFSRDRAKLAGTADLTNSSIPALNPAGFDPLNRGGKNNNSPTFAGRASIVNPITILANGTLLPGNFPDLGRVISGQLVLQNLATNQTTPASYRRFEPNPAVPGYRRQPGDFAPATDPARFNFRAFTPAIPAVEKAMYYVTGRYKIFGDGLQIYGDVMYSKTKQDNGLAAAPFAITRASNGRDDARASIFNPFGNNLSSVRYRLINELGPRRSFFDHDYYRYTAGLQGDFNIKDNGFISRFGYDTGFVYERFDEQRIDSGDATRTALRGLIANNSFDIFIGQNAPSVGTAPIYNNSNPAAPQFRTGVPIGTAAYNNLIAGNLNTADNNPGAAYLGHSFFYERDWLADAKVNGHLFPNLYNGGIDLAVGYEHREIATHQTPDPVQAAGDQLGFNASPNTKFLQQVNSVFTELNFPIVTSTMNVPFVRSLEISIAFRYEKFDNKDQYTHLKASFDNVNENENFGGTPRVSLRYQPVADLTLRANFNQAFRTPSPATLFNPSTQDFPQLFDPLNGVTLQPPNGVDELGNLQLKPEATDTYSAGLVYTPKFLPGFTTTVDLYQLYSKDVIVSAAGFAQIILTANGTSGLRNGGVPTLFTDQVLRDPGPFGALSEITNAQTANSGRRLVEGVDLTAVYAIPTLNFGTFTISGGFNHFFIYKAEGIAGTGTTNFLGNYNNGTVPLAPGGVPFNKGFLRGEWEWRGFDFVATGNYIGDYEDDPSFIGGNTLVAGNPNTGANLNFVKHHRISEYETLDMQLSYEFKKPEMQAAAGGYSKDAKDGKNAMSQVAGVDNGSIWQRMLWNTKLTVGVNNVFDRYPPTVLGAFNDNYDTSNYSIRNRYWYVSLKKTF